MARRPRARERLRRALLGLGPRGFGPRDPAPARGRAAQERALRRAGLPPVAPRERPQRGSPRTARASTRSSRPTASPRSKGSTAIHERARRRPPPLSFARRRRAACSSSSRGASATCCSRHRSCARSRRRGRRRSDRRARLRRHARASSRAIPTCDRVLTVPERPRLRRASAGSSRASRAATISRSRSLPGDRPTLYAWIAGRRRAGLCSSRRASTRWKRRAARRVGAFRRYARRTRCACTSRCSRRSACAPAAQVLRVVDARRRAARRRAARAARRRAATRCCIRIPSSATRCGRRDGWIAVARWLADRGLRVVLTGGPDADERALRRAHREAHARRARPRGQALARRRRARRLAARRSTSARTPPITHAAAALGVPTVALFGPTNPVKWGPWPAGHAGRRESLGAHRQPVAAATCGSSRAPARACRAVSKAASATSRARAIA